MPAPAMRAVRYDRYGPPDVLEVRALPRPVPQAGQVLVRVDAGSVNAVDAKVRSGALRLLTGRSFPRGVGADFAGTITEVGPGGDPDLPGRPVWGALDPLAGGATDEYLAVGPDAYALAPAGLDPVAAAALPTVGVTAVLAVEAVRLEPGRRVLVVGASGGVGNAAAQLAAAAGARVATVSGRANLDFCREHGAADAYAHEDLDGLRAERFDAVIDTHGTDLRAYRRLLRPGGRMATVAAKGAGAALVSVLTPGPRIGLVQAKATRVRLERLADLVERGDLRPAVERVYAMEELAEAHRDIATGHSRGKRVVRIGA
ncbi:NAD(P)-dependent alcohol dehydrogenase [Glycomyces sp. A-F 0318]|uniref:NAD(P)-dependent alcohol dehydrogenase n=1 Tax=Glycomyces amatae TaxID=2881355 RepID=UPI001E52BB23|nr:NAD(P)-dependent alcohol dehydrogenase [Glycomyces amatae]MCD0442927.1 NAD(P)-dependent alcohol dehydrogenase [Glycomyces amatae]